MQCDDHSFTSVAYLECTTCCCEKGESDICTGDRRKLHNRAMSDQTDDDDNQEVHLDGWVVYTCLYQSSIACGASGLDHTGLELSHASKCQNRRSPCDQQCCDTSTMQLRETSSSDGHFERRVNSLSEMCTLTVVDKHRLGSR